MQPRVYRLLQIAAPRLLGAVPWLVAALALLFGMVVFGQGNLGFLKDAPVSRFTQEDWEMARTAARAVMSDNSDNASQTWSNSASGNHGEITVVSTFRASDGRECRMVQFQNYAGGLSSSTRHPFCREEGGEWRFDASAMR